MTVEEARTDLTKRFPGKSVCAVKECWFHSTAEVKERDYYYINWNMQRLYSDRKEGVSFEDCFTQLDNENKDINAVIEERGILFRQFEI